MRVVDEEPKETIHLYVVPEDQLPPKPNFVDMFITTLCSLLLVGIVGLIAFSPKSEPSVSFTTTISGFHLPSVSKTITLSIHATGKGHINATSAQGYITFYNGQTYTQIIPIGTILKGADGISVVTEIQAVIPPAAQTTPPTYGHTTVPAHALSTGTSGNISAGDINQACCVTSVIAQNPYNFTGGKNARDYIYLRDIDVAKSVADLTPTLQQGAIALLKSSIVLNPTCSTTNTVNKPVGSEITTARLTLTTVCTAVSFSPTLAKNQIVEAGKRFGSLSNIQFSVVKIDEKKGVVTLRVYVMANSKPILRLPIR